ncbi:ribosome-inactivating protein [Durotheca rogersii]|uniref:ribosome-inactivating protein n=1 Tax=Durotheca rogersii TaxID=419775 RepID=UPI00221F0DBB|nr:ribosome-inactivating protein [Durotheca rogersii]KAI5866804.1 ribosome-inactivating protein [Durotheca rogersii]
MADFVVVFDVENSDGADYTQFIQGLRDRVASGDVCYYLPVLSPQPSTPNAWFDVVLTAGGRSVTLRIRRDNLYLDGYQQGTTWFEFQHNGPLYIPGATALRYDGSYTRLEGVAGQRREAIPLGQQALVNAVHGLSTAGISDQARARQLMVVIQMISESMRFQYINHHLATNWQASAQPPTTFSSLENAWGGLSEALLHAEQSGSAQSFRYRVDNDLQLHNVGAAAGVLAMLVHRSLPGPSRATRAIGAPWFNYPQGRALVEVFWVCINESDGEDPAILYGTIKAADGPSTQHLYNRDRDNTEHVPLRGHALLTGPREVISAADNFTIDVALWNRNTWLSDHEIAAGSIFFNVYDPKNQYDQAITHKASTEYGSATLSYVVLSNAAQALVTIVLVDGDGEDPADVYGTITADNGYGEIELFRKAKSEYVEVGQGQNIPLLRTALAVPMSGSLRIKALLYDHDPISPDDEIANGDAALEPLILQSGVGHIKGQYGKIEVRVEWN